MIAFFKRSLLLYYKDKTSVFFSLLSVFIVIGVYIFFLNDQMVTNLETLPYAKEITASWLVAGLLAITSLTTTMGGFGIMVDDKARKIDKDFISSPIPTYKITAGYVLGATFIGFSMTLLMALIMQIYFFTLGIPLLSLVTYLKIIAILFLSTLTNTAFMLLIVSFFRSNNAFATASTIIGTLAGFLTGIYVPIGNFSGWIRSLMYLFPGTYSASLLRQLYLEDLLPQAFEGASTELLKNFQETMGIQLVIFNTTITPIISVVILLVFMSICYGLAILQLSKKYKV